MSAARPDPRRGTVRAFLLLAALETAVFVLSWLVHRLSRLTLLPNLNLRRPILLALVLFLMASGLTAFVAVSLHACLTEWL